MVNEIAHVLSESDPSNAKKYNENADKTSLKIDRMVLEINKSINKKARFITFHDAYQYFENHFNISASGAISLGDASDPSPARLSEIRKRGMVAAIGFTVALFVASLEGTSSIQDRSWNCQYLGLCKR